jgi:hypothetical protein
VLVAHEAPGLDGEVARVAAEARGSLLLAVVDPVDLRPLRPWVVGRSLGRWLRPDLELHEARAIK